MDRIHFPTMVHFVKPIVDYASGVKALPADFFEEHPSYKLLFQDEELIDLAVTLMDLIPATDDNLRYHSKTINQVTLAHLVERIIDVRGKMQPDSLFSTGLSQVELKQVQFWNFECTIQDSYSSRPWSYNYFDLILDTLYKVAFISKIQLLACNLSNDHEKIYLNLEWRGPFKHIELLNIPGTNLKFWYASSDSEDPALPLRMMGYFLYLQVSTVWGENKLSRGEIQQNGNLTASIQLSQAASSEPPSELPISETVAENISDFIVRKFYPKHIEASEKLEVKLREELERRQRYIAQGLLESKFVDQINRWIDELTWFRNAYHKEISRGTDTTQAEN